MLNRLGIFGKPSDWLISSIPSYEEVKKLLGIELVDVKLEEVIETFNSLNQVDTSILNCFFPEIEKQKAVKIYQSFETIIKKYNLEGFTVRCFDLLTSLKSTGCVGLSFLNDKGIVSTCEGDIMAMICMYLVKKHFNQESFQANPSRIDTKDNSIVFAHCTLPTKMTKSFTYDTHFESGIGMAIKGEMCERDVTVFRISSDLKHYFISNGRIKKNLNEKDLCRTQIEVELDEDVKQILTNPCGNHHIIFYGHHKDELLKVLETIM